jgi:ABC-type amino acid transport substrate-binding protein
MLRIRTKAAPTNNSKKSIQAAMTAFIACFLSLCVVASAGADGLENARRRGRLIAGVKTDFPPFGYKDAAGHIQGFDADVARHLGQMLFDREARVELVPVTTGGRIPLLYSELIDVLIATMTITEERQRVLDYSNPYFVSGSMLLTLKESTIQNVQDLAGKNVGVLEGAVQQRDLSLIAPEAKRIAFKSLPEALQALQHRRVDALCQDDVALLAEAQRNADVKIVGASFLPRPYAMAVRQGEDHFLNWLNAQLEKMKADGTLLQLRRKHFGDIETALPAP